MAFYVDDRLIKVVRQSPAYPMQLIPGIYEFADGPAPKPPATRRRSSSKPSGRTGPSLRKHDSHDQRGGRRSNHSRNDPERHVARAGSDECQESRHDQEQSD